MLVEIKDVSDSTLVYAREIAVRNFGWKADAVETMGFARQLETIKAKVYRKKYSELLGRNFVPVSTEASRGSRKITYRMWDSYVVAKICSNAATDIELVTASAAEFSAKFQRLANGYQFSLDDLLEAQESNTELTTELAYSARRGIEQGLDSLIAYGSPENGMTGLTNHPNVPVIVVPTGSWTVSTTADQMLADLHAMAQGVVNQSNQLWIPDTLLLDTISYGLIAGKVIGDNYGTTVLKAFLAQTPYIQQVGQWILLNSASPTGGKRAVVYKKDPEVLEFEMSQDFEQLPEQTVGLTFRVFCSAKAAGVVVRHPLAIAYIDNL